MATQKFKFKLRFDDDYIDNKKKNHRNNKVKKIKYIDDYDKLYTITKENRKSNNF